VDPVPDPLLLRKSGSAGNRTRDLCICSQKLDHSGGPNNDTCTICIRDFSKEQYELPEDDKQYAIETCRSLLIVLV
jgi:hypothetical protein